MTIFIFLKKFFSKKPCLYGNKAAGGQTLRSISQSNFNIPFKRPDNSVLGCSAEKKKRTVTFKKFPFVSSDMDQPKVLTNWKSKLFSKYKKNNKKDNKRKIRILIRNNNKKPKSKNKCQNNKLCFPCCYFHTKRTSRIEACIQKENLTDVLGRVFGYLFWSAIIITLLSDVGKHFLVYPIKFTYFCWIAVGPFGLACQMLVECFCMVFWRWIMWFKTARIFYAAASFSAIVLVPWVFAAYNIKAIIIHNPLELPKILCILIAVVIMIGSWWISFHESETASEMGRHLLYVHGECARNC